MRKKNSAVFLLILWLIFCCMDAFAVDDTVFTDGETGLMWQTQDNGFDISWPAAKEYCEQLEYAGFSDWRMPSQDELATLYRVDAAESSDYYMLPAITVSACCQWAIDKRLAKVASYDYEYGNRDWGYPMSTVDARVLAVRDL